MDLKELVFSSEELIFSVLSRLLDSNDFRVILISSAIPQNTNENAHQIIEARNTPSPSIKPCRLKTFFLDEKFEKKK